MKPSSTLNIAVAAITGGVVAAIIQMTNSSLPEKKISSFDTTPPSTMSPNNGHYENQDPYSHLVEELNNVKTALKNLNDQQSHIQQIQESLSKSFLSLKDYQNTQSQTAVSTLQGTHNDSMEESEGSIEEEPQFSRILSLDEQMWALDSDTAWESEALGTITSAFENIDLEGSSLQTVECQGITCRIEVVHNSRIDAELFFEDSFRIVPWDHRGRIELIEDGNNNITSIYYATREKS